MVDVNVNLSSSHLINIPDHEVLVPDNTHIVIPLMTFVFGFPIIVILILCLVQHRNKVLQKRDSERLHNRRLSTQSTIYTGLSSARNGGMPPPSSQETVTQHAALKALRLSSYVHKNSLLGLAIEQNFQAGRTGSFNTIFGLTNSADQKQKLSLPIKNFPSLSNHKSSSAHNLSATVYRSSPVTSPVKKSESSHSDGENANEQTSFV